MTHPDLNKISKITDNIFLSGILPLYDANTLKNLCVKYVLSCVDRKYIGNIHDTLLLNNPNLQFYIYLLKI